MYVIDAPAAVEAPKSVTFASTRTVGGNWSNYNVDADASITFTTSRNIGLVNPTDSESASYAKAAADHRGITFTTSRSIGQFAAQDEGNTSQDWTLITDADEEEDKAVTSATVGTFFGTFFVAIIIGLAIGYFCCYRKGKGSSQPVGDSNLQMTAGNATPVASAGNDGYGTHDPALQHKSQEP